MTLTTTLVAPPDAAAWDALVAVADGASVFHPSTWARMWIAEWPDARWEALVIPGEGGGYAAALGMIVRDGPLGRRVMAMPWATYGGPLVRRDHSDPAAARRALLAGFAERVRNGVMV